MLEVLFCCSCGHSGVIFVSRKTWLDLGVKHTCPSCRRRLDQPGLHFEVMDRALQRERVGIIYKHGVLSKSDRERLREIHAILGNEPPERIGKDRMDLVLKRGAAVIALVRDEMRQLPIGQA